MAYEANIAAGTLNTNASPVRSILIEALNRFVNWEKSYRDRAHIARMSDELCKDVGLSREQMMYGTNR